MLRSVLPTAAIVGAVLALAGEPAFAVVIPKPPPASTGKAKPKGKPAPAPAPAAAPEVAPISPLLVRRRAAPPPRSDAASPAPETLAAGQSWSIAVVAADNTNCRGSVQVRRQMGAGAFEGDATLACQASATMEAFRGAATLVESADGVVLSLGGAGDPKAVTWPAVRLMKEAPDRMSGAVLNGGRNLAFTLLLAGG